MQTAIRGWTAWGSTSRARPLCPCHALAPPCYRACLLVLPPRWAGYRTRSCRSRVRAHVSWARGQDQTTGAKTVITHGSLKARTESEHTWCEELDDDENKSGPGFATHADTSC